MKERKTLFRFMLDDLKKNQAPIKEEYNYIGTGNPLADILLIGKECSVSRQGNSKQYKEEIVDNFKMWCTVEDFDTGKINEHDFGNYNPLYPYKGQLLKKDNGSNLGTSVTWMNYQKLFNFIYKIGRAHV